ncbi:MAG: YihY/virulence factor BrkB family protein [Coriobacteriales bacterium]|nr:YihY/virulence factor BrkB family protein [Coriobacteriales bacterium]
MWARVAKARSLWNEFSAISASTYASSIAYYSFMSLVPLVAIVISLVSVLGLGQEEVLAFFKSIAPQGLYEFLDTLVSDAFARSGLAFSVSTITLLWSASKSTRALRNGLNVAYGTSETRSTPFVVVISVVAVIVLGSLLAATMYLVFSDGVARWLTKIVPSLKVQDGLVTVFNVAATLGLGVLGLALTYAYLPAGMRRPFSQLPGAVVATLACGVISFGFRIYVDQIGNYTVLYGSLGTIIIFLLWMFLIYYAILLGGFVNRHFAR